MKTLRDGTTVGLDRYRILRLEHAHGVSVRCETGMLWLTQEGDPEDALLAPGERIRIGTGRLVLIEALQDSTLRLSAPERGIGSDPSGQAVLSARATRQSSARSW